MAIRSQSLTDFLAAKATIEQTTSDNDIGDTLRFMRTSAGLSQMFVASNAGVTQAYLSMVEKGTKTPSADSLKRIIEAVSEGSADGTQDQVD